MVTKMGLRLPIHDQCFNPELFASHPSHNPRCHRNLFATTAFYDRGDNVVTEAGKPRSTHAIHRIITEGLLSAGMKKLASWSTVYATRPPTFALLNDANSTRVQNMMRRKHYATTEIYVEDVQKLLEGQRRRSHRSDGVSCGAVA